jgi:glycosyltransferase involved in cell wall biosynthesis
MKKVLVYKTELLHLSETFIREQVQSYQEWIGVLVGMWQVPGLSLQELDVRLLGSTPAQQAGFYAKALRRLQWPQIGFLKRLRRERASLVHVHFGTDAVDFWPIARWLGIPIIITLHGYDITVSEDTWKKDGGDRSRYPKRLLALAQSPNVHFIAVSNAIRQRAMEFGLPEKRINVRYIGISCARFHHTGKSITERRRRILFVGRLVEKKGVSYLLQAYVRVLQSVPDAELIIVGDGPLRTQLESLAHELSVPAVFLGGQNADQIRQHLSEARLFCLPSVTASDGDSEGFGMVLLEAQASGVPVVTSAQGGAQEGIINGVTGFAFAERDVDGLSSALTKLLTDDELIARMSDAAPRFVKENFDLHQRTRALEEFYDQVVEQHQ